MATTSIQVSFTDVLVTDSGQTWGPRKWSFKATVAGQAVGKPDAAFSARARDTIALPPGDWSTDVDVSACGPDDTVEIAFQAFDGAVDSGEDLGTVKLLLRYPFQNEVDGAFDAKGGKDGPRFVAGVKVALNEAAAAAKDPEGAAPAAKDAEGSAFSTIMGSFFTPRVEVCPVVPVPPADKLPPRPLLLSLLTAGKATQAADPVPLKGALKPNCLANPALVPILPAGHDKLADEGARLAVTYKQPGNVKPDGFHWFVASGPAVIEGKSEGVEEILVRGTGAGKSDQIAQFELRLKDAHGPLLSTFRAHVGTLRHIPFRATIVRGTTKAARPRVTPSDVQRHVNLANALFHQAGLKLVPDPDPKGYDGAVADPKFPGIFVLNVANNGLTMGVNSNLPPKAMRLNSNPGVMHLLYIKSFDSDGAAGVATDRPGLSGAKVTLDGSPSASWVRPSGVAPDSAAKPVTMLTMNASKLRKKASDKKYLKGRGLPEDAFKALYGVTLPDYTKPSDPDWPQTVAHEVGHTMGLRHRGNGFSKKKPGSDDDVNDPKGVGYPNKENVMCYGYALSQDFDLIQTQVIRDHPVVVAPGGPKPKPKPKAKTKLEDLQERLGVPVTNTWDDPTDAAAKKHQVHYYSKGDVVKWVQERLIEDALYPADLLDGIAGEKTIKGIRGYQKAHPPLSVDGIAGRKTLRSMAEA
jgi:hypothetical protein